MESITEPYLVSKNPKKRVFIFLDRQTQEEGYQTQREVPVLFQLGEHRGHLTNFLYQNPYEAHLLFGDFRVGVDCHRYEQEKLAAKNEKDLRDKIRKDGVEERPEIQKVLIVSSLSTAVVASGDLDRQLVGWGPAKSGYHRTTTDDDGEFDLVSEVSRCILTTSKYISYDALSRSIVPGSRRGASYYNCQAGAQANPYSSG